MKKNKLFNTIVLLIVVLCTSITSCANKCETSADEILLSNNWKVQSSAKIGTDGQALSDIQLNTQDWYAATVPSTVMGVLTKAGLYQDLLTDTNYKEADRTPFDVSWWYCNTFALTADQVEKYVQLQFDGLTYRANIWLNGKLVAPKEEVFGAFRRFSFDITNLVKEENVLAVEVFRAQAGEPNIGFVDWNPRPLDENMGIFREVRLIMSGDVGMKNTWVRSKVNTETLQEAWINIETQVENYSDTNVKGKIEGRIEDVKFSIPVELNAKEKQIVKITEKDIADLHIRNPRLWWCNNLGTPELYDLDLKFVINNELSAQENISFGIRQVDTYMTPGGHKGITLNGKKVLMKSAGWTDDIFLRDTPETNEIQVQYVKDMNLNMIRFENVWGTSQNIYNLCDRYGLLAFVGWSCQWEWEAYLGTPDDEYGCIRSEQDMDLLANYWHDQVVWLRNHPSVAVWMGGSDKIPRPALEKKYLELMKTIDDRPYIAASQSVISDLSGPTGMKMYGPYEYVGPNYWFVDTKYGGGYGFNTETGVGAQLPVLESIEKMIPKDKLWPLNKSWDFHCTTSTTALNTLGVNNEAMEGMFGKANNLKEYLDRSHLMAYQSTKSMFEAFRINKAEATGIVQWMLNSAWPSLYWQLYDYYMTPVPAYYGVKRANTPLQLIYNYKDGIYAVNESIVDADDMKAVIRAYDIQSKLLYEKEIPFTLKTETVQKLIDIDNSAKNTFLFMSIIDNNGKVVSENFYALSSVADTYKWDKTNWVGTPMDKYADFKALGNMPKSELKVNLSQTKEGAESVVWLDIENVSSSIAFFSQFVLKNKDGEILSPVRWEDNYINVSSI